VRPLTSTTLVAFFDRGTYFITIKQKDGENDRASNLDRKGVWRLNMGVCKSVYFELFGPPSSRPGKGVIGGSGWDFTPKDQLTVNGGVKFGHCGGAKVGQFGASALERAALI